MATYTDAEQARQRAIAALRDAGFYAGATIIAACPPITNRKTALYACDAARAVLPAARQAALAARAPRALYNAARAAAYAADAS